MGIENRVAVVTGAATGIGAAFAAGLANAGARVIGVDISAVPDSEDGRIEHVQCDLSDAEDVKRCFDDIIARTGGVDILVNDAALASVIKPQPFDEITAEEWNRVLTVNTIMTVLCSGAVVPHMREQKWGRIVNLTSATVFLGTPFNLHYVASKGAIAAMTRAMAKELGSYGITVNAIAPGLTLTDGIRSNPAYTDEMLDGNIEARAIQRAERPEDLVGACLFLVDEGANFMTGQILTVDGGVAFH